MEKLSLLLGIILIGNIYLKYFYKLYLRMRKKLQPIIIMKIVAIIMLFWALADNPYFYYQILHWVICWLAVYLTYLAYQNKKNIWIWLFAISAVCFNPILPIYFSREIWSVLDILVAVMILISIFKTKNSISNKRID